MADYNANIKVNADTRAAEQAIKRLTTELNKIQSVSTAVSGVKNIGEAFVPKQALTRLEKGLQTLANRANTTEKVFARLVEGVGTLGASGAVLGGLNEALKGVATATGQSAANFSGAARKIDEFAAAGDTLRTTLAQVNNLLIDVGHEVSRVVVPGFAAMDDTAQATAQTANKLQYALQQFIDSTEGIRTFVNNIGTLEGAAGAATVGLTALAAVIEGQLSEALYDIDVNASAALKQLADDAARGTSELQRLIRATQGTVDQYEQLIAKGRERLRTVNAESDEARRAANTITQGQKLLNTELETQNNLLREAAGLRPESVERRATNTYNVAQRRKQFYADQAAAAAEELQNKRKLEQAESSAARTRLAAAAKEKADALNEQAEAARRALEALRNLETAETAAAKERLAQVAELRRTSVTEVVRRPIAGAAYTSPAGPGGSGVTSASAVAAEAELRRKMVVAGFQTLTYAQKEAAQSKITLETRYNWARVLAQGTEISEDLVRLSAEDAQNAELTLRAKRTEAKLEEAIARNRKNATQAEERAAAKKQRRTDISSAVIGGAFPLLFGQGVGASFGGALGGGLGARFGGQGGFAGSLVGTFAGQATIDFAINSATQLGNALRKPTQNIQELTKFLGIAGTQLDANITVLQNLGLESSASAIALAKLEDILKADGYKNLDNLSKQLTDLENAFSRLKLAAANLLAEPLTEFLNWLTDTMKLISRAGGVGGFITTSPKNLQALDKQIQRERTTSTQTAEKPGTAELAAQKLISQEEQRQLDLAGAQVQLERQRLSLTRVELASKQGSIELLRISNDLEKKNVELNNAKEKSKRKQLELDIKLLQQQQAQAEAARQNAIIEAQRQVQKELLNLYNQQYEGQNKLNNLYVENVALSKGQLAGIQEQGKYLDTELKNRFAILYNQREAALLGVNELEVRDAIIKSYDYQAQQLQDELSNKKLLNKQQEAEYNLTQLQIAQQRELNKLQAENQAQRELRELTSALDPRFMQPFGGSRRTQELMQAEFEARSSEMRATLAGVETQLAVPGLAPDLQKRLEDQRKELQNQIAVYTEYQPAIIQATAAQQRFNEALAITSPLVDSVFTGITGIVAGTQTAQEAFANFLSTVGQMLLDTAKQMIAQYIALGIAKIFAFGSNFSFSGAGPAQMPSGPGFAAGFTMPKLYAEGGFVAGPTNAIIGEGGEPEYVIPASKMSAAMSRYSAGARGAAVIPGSGESGTGMGTAAVDSAPIDVRYTVERINSVDYVTAEEFRLGMRKAATEGAVQGERRAIKSLQNNRSTRGRLGMR